MDEVILSEYNPQWPSLFEEEASRVRQAIGDGLIAIEHIGSTSVPGLASKPVIDLLAAVRTLTEGERAVPCLAVLDYEYRGENGIPGRLFFRKGPVQYRRTHHLHMVEPGHEQWVANLRFRDYLRAHSEEACRYEALKRGLAIRFRDNRAAYTDGKTDYILAVLKKAGAAGTSE